MDNDRIYDVTIHYPLPLNRTTERYFDYKNFPGWFASGSDFKIRDIRLDANREEILQILSDIKPDWTIEIRLRAIIDD